MHHNTKSSLSTANMSSFQQTTSSNPHPKLDEHEWIIHICRTIEDEFENDNDSPVCIFNVPKTLLSSDMDSYTPQEVAIGPYHYFCPKLQVTERYKLAAANRIEKKCQSLKLRNLVEQLIKLMPKIRSCYHNFLAFSNETLGWMMAIDAAFLLEFLQIYASKEGMELTRVSSRMSHLIDYAGIKSSHNAILRDIVMSENQIPLFVLRKMLEFVLSSLESADDMLCTMLTGLCKELSPFKMMENLPKIHVSESAHLLDYMYLIIMPKVEKPSKTAEVEVQIEAEVEDQIEAEEGKEKASPNSSYVKQFLSEIWKLLSKLNIGPIKAVSKPVKLLLKLPSTTLSKLPGFSILNKDSKPENESLDNDINKPPLVEQITIPSVTRLSKSGVHFLPTTGNISTISFDTKTLTFYLPTVTLDVNTEVVLRNLVAYEASNASGPLVFTRYTELMNGIIDTEEDVKLLREQGIILNHLKSDKEAAELWNGMSMCVRLTKVSFLDKAIEDVNKYHNCQWRVKMGHYVKRYVYGSWQFLTLLATIMLLLLTALEAFCSVYSCGRIFDADTTP